MKTKKMNKLSKRFYITLFLTMLLVCSTYTALIPSARASEVTLQQKGQAILNNVIGVDLTKYSVATSEVTQEPYLEVTTRDNVQYVLHSGTSKLQMFCTFVKGNLRLLNVLNNTGSQSMLVSDSNPLDMAKGFLSRYNTYSGNALYSNLELTLTNIDASKSSSTLFGNTELNVTTSADSTTFRWTYEYNGIQAPEKCVVLSYTNGFLKYFIDNWDLYKIGSTRINLSETEAVNNGLDEAKAYSWAMLSNDSSTVQFKDFNVTGAMLWGTTFSNAYTPDKARDNDPFTLYPVRHVWVSLDKFYPGNVYGIEVFFWADTKSVYTIKERCATVDSQELVTDVTPIDSSVDPTSNSIFAIPLIVLAALVLSSLWLSKRKSVFHSRAAKLLVSLLCVLLLSSIVMETVSSIDRNALIWGSTSSGAYDAELHMSWRKTATEVAIQDYLADYIADGFDEFAGYTGAHDYQGDQSVKSNILGNISTSQANYPFTAVVDFDHGVGNERYGYDHSMFEDDRGCVTGPYPTPHTTEPANGVYDYEIYDATGNTTCESNAYFVYISTCLSANLTRFGQYRTPNGYAVGMPYCWTHRIVALKTTPFDTGTYMSQFGYNDSDTGNYCFIGFPWGSASLSQSIEHDSQLTYSAWMGQFFGYALHYGMTVRDALDTASQTLFTYDFGSMDLYTNFTARWPMYLYNETIEDYDWTDNGGYVNSTLAIYGNSNMYLRGPELTVNAYDSYSNPVSASVYINGDYAGTAGNTFRVPMGQDTTVEVRSASYTFHKFTGYADFQNPITFAMGTYDVTITANYYANPPPQYDLYVSCGEGGSLNITSGHNYFYPQNVTVVATPDGGRYFDHWVLDENTYYNNPITVPMSSGHTLQAVFDPTYATTVNAYVTWDGYSYYYYDSATIYKPAGSNYLTFGAYFVQAYNYYDSSTHYSDPDWYNLGTGTTIDVYYNLSGY